MFWDIFVRLCQSHGVSPNAVAKSVGVKSSGTVSAWKKGAIPRDGILTALSDYFGVSVDYLLGTSAESFMDDTEFRLAEAEREYEKTTDAKRREELALEIDVLRESLEDQKLAALFTPTHGTKNTPAEESGRFDSFTMAAHGYSGRLSEKDKAIILDLMKTLARDVDETDGN